MSRAVGLEAIRRTEPAIWRQGALGQQADAG
jgi:hypothetical protein